MGLCVAPSITTLAESPVEMLLFSLIFNNLVSDGARESSSFPPCPGVYPFSGWTEVGTPCFHGSGCLWAQGDVSDVPAHPN